nr:MAG TPA: hypothetical protein [Caudoviricetes sp.]
MFMVIYLLKINIKTRPTYSIRSKKLYKAIRLYIVMLLE